MKKGWRICIDFDGVINSYTSGYKPGDDSYLPDPPVPGAKEFLVRCLNCFQEVYILSARCQTLSGMIAVKEWLKKYNMPDIPVSYVKYPAEVYIDDRGWRFEGVFPDPAIFVDMGTWSTNKEKENNQKWLRSMNSK